MNSAVTKPTSRPKPGTPSGPGRVTSRTGDPKVGSSSTSGSGRDKNYKKPEETMQPKSEKVAASGTPKPNGAPTKVLVSFTF